MLGDYGGHPEQSTYPGAMHIDIPVLIVQLQLSSVHFDLITQEMLQLQYIRGIHAGPGPH